MKQTAVEWLINQIEEKGDARKTRYTTIIKLYLDTPEYNELIKQAKEMEKTQHNKTADDWWEKGTDWMVSITQPETQSFDKYYEERFKK
jgi:hypothetical protein